MGDLNSYIIQVIVYWRALAICSKTIGFELPSLRPGGYFEYPNNPEVTPELEEFLGDMKKGFIPELDPWFKRDEVSSDDTKQENDKKNKWAEILKKNFYDGL